MKALIQTGSSGRVPVPPEKRFLINWGVVEGSKVLREYQITAGKIQTGGGRGRREIADYVLVYKDIKLAVIEAKSDELEVGESYQ